MAAPLRYGVICGGTMGTDPLRNLRPAARDPSRRAVLLSDLGV